MGWKFCKILKHKPCGDRLEEKLRQLQKEIVDASLQVLCCQKSSFAVSEQILLGFVTTVLDNYYVVFREESFFSKFLKKEDAVNNIKSS